MSISIACSACGKQYKLDDRFAGKRVKCNRCGSTFAVPAVAPAPVEEPAPSAEPTFNEPDATPGYGAPADGTPGEPAHAEHETSEHASPEGGESSNFETSSEGDGFGAASAEADHAAHAESEHEDEPAGAQAEESGAIADPAPVTRYPVSQALPRFDRVVQKARPAPAPAKGPSSATGSAGIAAPAPHKTGGGLSDLIAAAIYVLGIGVEIFGWSQVAAVEFYGRRIERQFFDEAASLRLIRLQVRGGIFVVAGLLILIVAAVIHLRGALKHARTV